MSHSIKPEIVIEAQGTDPTAKPIQMRATVLAPKGQTHLTAVGAAIQLDRLLGLDGAPPPSPTIIFPDTAPQTSHALSMLRASGIAVKLEALA